MTRSVQIRSVAALCCALSCALPCASHAQAAPSAVIRIWGHGHRGQDYIQTLLSAWQTGYVKSHPGVRFEDHLYGNASAIGSLFTGVADLAILDREASFIEVDAFQQGAGFDPFAIPVAQGSVATPHHAPALKVYVHRDNPLSKLTLEQLDGIFDADHRRSQRSYKTWGDLGLTGDWADKPIHLYAPAIQTAEMQFFERAALKGSQKFSCCLTLLAPERQISAGSQAVARVAADKFGLAVSIESSTAAKEIALAASEGDDAVTATGVSIAAGSYPLARTVYIYANRKPKTPVPANVAGFLAYIVSPEGQAIVARTGGYLPLSPDLVARAKGLLQ